MIEDKSIGLKVAESEIEAFWTDLKQKCEKQITLMKHEIEIQEWILQLCNNNLEAEEEKRIGEYDNGEPL